MATISCPCIEKPEKKFYCKVLRADVFNVIYKPKRWEFWVVLAETLEGAFKIARYHFYRSNEKDIIVKEQPIS